VTTVEPAVWDLDVLDPWRPCPGGVYADAHVEVVARPGPPPRRELHMVRTPHFDLRHVGPRLAITHRVPASAVDDDLAGLLADELFSPGWVRGQELFERIFTGVVLTSAPTPLEAWSLFYRNTLALVSSCLTVPRGSGTVADYAPVYAAVERLLADGDVLELGSCFGFLSLRLAAAGRRVLATDLDPGTVGVLAQVAPRLGIALSVGVADAVRTGLPDASADNVLAVHLLEHLPPERGDRVLEEMLRLARRRVVLAVPLEEVADETWGHVRTVSLGDLDRWGSRSGRPYAVAEDHGGWLVIEA
jgi:hypothetical protein